VSGGHCAEGVGLTSAAVRTGVGAVVVAILTVTAPACTNARDSDREASATPTPATTFRSSCEAALPADWQEAIEGSAVRTGGVSTVPLAVGRAGEVVAVRDNGDTRDLLLVGADKSVREIYAVPDPDQNDVGFIAMDDRWIVVGVDRIPRDANGVIPTLVRIDVLDRQAGSVRTVAQGQAPGDAAGAARLNSAALFRGKVYWIETNTSGAREEAILNTYDLAKGRVVTEESGAKGGVWAGTAGLTFGMFTGTPLPRGWARSRPDTEMNIAAPLPTPVADALGTGQDRLTLATDGTAYAWITGFDQGGTGVGWWSPQSGLVRVGGEVTGEVVPLPPETTVLPPLHVVGPYVVVGNGRDGDTPEQHTVATVVDTRSGAVTFLRNVVAGADGGTMAMRLANPRKAGASAVGVVRSDALSPLSC